MKSGMALKKREFTHESCNVDTMGKNVKCLGHFMNCRENRYFLLAPRPPTPSHWGRGFRSEHFKVTKHQVVKKVSWECSYPERLLLHCKYSARSRVIRGREGIGVNRPAIVREIPHFCLFPAFPHFCQNVPHFWLYFEIIKIAEIAIILAVRRHFVRQSSAKT